MRIQPNKQTRFEVFKRDQFTCQYCGRKPPAVVLNCDHVEPVANGGGNDMLNLVTACWDCNSGKSDNPLERILIPVGPSAEERRERLEQLKEYQKVLSEETAIYEEWGDKVIEKWSHIAGHSGAANTLKVQSYFENAVKKFVRRLMLEEVLEAVNIAWDRFPNQERKRFQFFCGVCWKKVRFNNSEKAR